MRNQQFCSSIPNSLGVPTEREPEKHSSVTRSGSATGDAARQGSRRCLGCAASVMRGAHSSLSEKKTCDICNVRKFVSYSKPNFSRKQDGSHLSLYEACVLIGLLLLYNHNFFNIDFYFDRVHLNCSSSVSLFTYRTNKG